MSQWRVWVPHSSFPPLSHFFPSPPLPSTCHMFNTFFLTYVCRCVSCNKNHCLCVTTASMILLTHSHVKCTQHEFTLFYIKTNSEQTKTTVDVLYSSCAIFIYIFCVKWQTHSLLWFILLWWKPCRSACCVFTVLKQIKNKDDCQRSRKQIKTHEVKMNAI